MDEYLIYGETLFGVDTTLFVNSCRIWHVASTEENAEMFPFDVFWENNIIFDYFILKCGAFSFNKKEEGGG